MNSSLYTFLLLTTFLASTLFLPASSDIGINYGTNGDNLPSPPDAINLYKKCNIHRTRLFEPNHDILEALRGSNILVTVGTRNEDLPTLGAINNPDGARAWIETNILPYKDNVAFEYITMGNEVIPGPLAAHVPSAIANFQTALNAVGLGNIKVSTVVSMSVLGASYPPSAGAFSNEVIEIMRSIITTIQPSNTPLMINVYPYFAYASDPAHIALDYATFRAQTPIVVDGQYEYFNLFDAIVDAVYVAVEKLGVGDVALVISESGWPSAGNGPDTNTDNALAYNYNLIQHVTSKGTPRRPEKIMDTFIFALFNENLKQAGVEQNFGLFYPNMQPVYPALIDCKL